MNSEKFIAARSNLRHLFDQRGVSRCGGDQRVGVPDHRRAGRRRHHNGFGIGEHTHEPPHQIQRFGRIAGIMVHLTATGLVLGKLDLVIKSLQQPHHRLSGAGIHGVGDAGDEQ
jgi:hypothetical protein